MSASTGPTPRSPLPARRGTASTPATATVFGPSGHQVLQAQLRVGEPEEGSGFGVRLAGPGVHGLGGQYQRFVVDDLADLDPGGGYLADRRVRLEFAADFHDAGWLYCVR